MSKKDFKVAILDNSIDPSLYTPIDHWKAYLGVKWESFRAIKSKFPDLKRGYTHIIVSGSEASILERDKWVYEEMEIIQEAVDRGISILGSCYGHQLLALTLLGASYVRRCPTPEIGWIPIQIDHESELLGKRRQAYTFTCHFDEVVNLDDSFQILASTKESPIQAFQKKGRPIWGIQIHPEIDISSGKRFLKDLISLNLKTTPFFEDALKLKPRDSGLIRQIITSFLTARETY